jgi:hypothetical protein
MGRTVRRTVHGVKGLTRELNKLRDLPKEATDQLRDESVAIAARVAAEARGRAMSGAGGRVSRYVAPTIRATRDRVPVISMGGSARLPPSSGSTRSGIVGDVMWGAEFGSAQHRQFQPWGGSGGSAGYFLWPSVRMDEIIEEWGDALLRAVDEVIT